MTPSCVVLVEGRSDAAVLEVLGRRLGLDAPGVEVVDMGGVTNLGAHLDRCAGVRVAILYDAGEERFVVRALEHRGLDDVGFFRCESDLEDELIRALGTDLVVEVIDREGELGLLETFQQQPYQRARPLHDQLHRFCGTKSGRKARLAAAIAEALPLERVPTPLSTVLEFAHTSRR